MILEAAIVSHGTANLTETNDWYRWPVNSSFLPPGVILSNGNCYAQNVSLKLKLSTLYLSGNNEEKVEITRYYISKWGGIKRNNDGKLRSYALDAPASLIDNGSQGIASWSKALCIRCPSDYAIYDARVALSLNCLQITAAVEQPIIFPLLAGQNKQINAGSKMVRQYAINHRWHPVAERQFYKKYITVLSAAADNLNVKIYTLEMLLFATAPVLLKEAFPENKI